MDTALDTILNVAPDATRTAALATTVPTVSAVVVAEPALPAVLAPVVIDKHAEELNDDMEFAREQIKQLIDDGRSAMNGAMELATAGDQARSYEVVGGLITAIVQANKELINLHKTRKETLKTDKEAQRVETGGQPVINIDKAVFAGRASDLLRELQQVKKDTAAALAVQSNNTDAAES